MAMGVQVALARLGTAAALGINLPLAKSFGLQLPVSVAFFPSTAAIESSSFLSITL